MLPELDGLDEEPLALDGLEVELDGLELLLPEPELMPLEELEPLEADCPASHSLYDSLPSWSLSSLSNSARPEDDEELPPEAEVLGLDDEDVPPADEDEGEDDLLLCDMEGELLDPLVLFDESAA